MSPSLRRYLLLLPSSVLFFLVVPTATLYSGRLIDEALLPGLEIWSTSSAAVGLLFLLSGGYFVLESIRVLLVTGGGIPLGDLIPSYQSETLVRDGVYALTRNPMLFGYLLALSGGGLLALSFSTAFAFPLLYTAIWTAWIKGREEPALERRFGDDTEGTGRRHPSSSPGCCRRGADLKSHRLGKLTINNGASQILTDMRPRKLPKMTREEIDELLDSESICRIAFRGDKYPYIAPFQYVRHGGALYFHFTNYGRKMRLLKADSNVCVGVERLEPDLSEYRFVALSGALERVDEVGERSEVLRLLSEAGRKGLSQNFLAAHGFETEESWSALSDDAPLVVYKLARFTDVVGLRSPYQS